MKGRTFFVLLAALVGALAIGALFILLAKSDPIRAYKVMLTGPFSSSFGFTETLVRTTPLLLTGLGIIISFRCGVLNIGGEGQILIGAIASAQAIMLPLALASFRESFPHCRVHLAPGVSLDLMDQVDAGNLDLAVLIRPPFDLPADLQWGSLEREEYVLLVPASVEGDDWRTIVSVQPFIRYDRTSFGGRQVERLLRTTSTRPREWLEVDDLHAIVAVVARGLGVAIAPLTQMTTPLPPNVRAVPLGRDVIHREIGVLARTPSSEIVQAFLACLPKAASTAAP